MNIFFSSPHTVAACGPWRSVIEETAMKQVQIIRYHLCGGEGVNSEQEQVHRSVTHAALSSWRPRREVVVSGSYVIGTPAPARSGFGVYHSHMRHAHGRHSYLGTKVRLILLA